MNRRAFLAASASALASAQAPGAVPASGEVDVVIVGAGAAGIAAARRVAAAGRRFALIEAAERVGGRCLTDIRTFGVPYDRGAHWLHMPDINPVAKLAPRVGLEVYPAPPGQRLRIGRRNAREGEMEEFLATLVRTNRAIQDAARKGDVPCAQALPRDLGEWRPTMEFILGPYGCGKDLADISAQDFARSAERDIDAFCRQGVGTLIARLADSLPVQLATPATEIDLRGRQRVEVATPKGRIVGRAAIVTASTNLLLAGKLKFEPDLPKRITDALASLSLGSYDHIALEFEGNPLGIARDELIFEKADDRRTAAILANVSGTALSTVEVGGRFGRELSEQGSAAMIAFAGDWLAGLYGSDIKRAIKRSHATRWNAEPLALGAFSAASPGDQQARRVLMEPQRSRLWLAGEAVHETLWGTVGGAWESGERAAEAALRQLGHLPPLRREQREHKEPSAPARRPRRQAAPPPPRRLDPPPIRGRD